MLHLNFCDSYFSLIGGASFSMIPSLVSVFGFVFARFLSARMTTLAFRVVFHQVLGMGALQGLVRPAMLPHSRPHGTIDQGRALCGLLCGRIAGRMVGRPLLLLSSPLNCHYSPIFSHSSSLFLFIPPKLVPDSWAHQDQV